MPLCLALQGFPATQSALGAFRLASRSYAPANSGVERGQHRQPQQKKPRRLRAARLKDVGKREVETARSCHRMVKHVLKV